MGVYCRLASGARWPYGDVISTQSPEPGCNLLKQPGPAADGPLTGGAHTVESADILDQIPKLRRHSNPVRHLSPAVGPGADVG